MIGSLFGGSGLGDYGIGDLLGTRDRANAGAQQRRLLSLILQTASRAPDLQRYMPGFSLPGPQTTEQPAPGGFFGLSGLFPGLGNLGGDEYATVTTPEETGRSRTLRNRLALEEYLQPTAFSRKTR